jgi:hypothetical protein
LGAGSDRDGLARGPADEGTVTVKIPVEKLFRHKNMKYHT